MELNKLLPIGSVVLLKDAKKKIVIMGNIQMKKTAQGDFCIYDYMGVPYPLGYVGSDAFLLFNHADIQEIIFTGYSDSERELFIRLLETTEQAVHKSLGQK